MTRLPLSIPIHFHYSWKRQPTEPGLHYAMSSCLDEQLLRCKIQNLVREALDWNEPRAPAGPLRGKLQPLDSIVCSELTAVDRDNCYELGINPIRYSPGFGLVLWGSRFITLAGEQADIIKYGRGLTQAQINYDFIALTGWQHAVRIPFSVGEEQVLHMGHWLDENAQDEFSLKHSTTPFQIDSLSVTVFFQSIHDAVKFKLFFYY